MHRFSAPIILDTVNEQTYPWFLARLREAKVTRVILCGLGPVYRPEGNIQSCATFRAHLAKTAAALREEGFEVAFWIGGFGHGAPLQHETERDRPTASFTALRGLDGREGGADFCPSDPTFRAAYAKGLRILAALHPDLIMIDDDFRINVRDAVYDLACFCDRCMGAICDLVGEQMTREEFRKKAFVGGKNPYRCAYMRVTGENLLSFAREMRAAVDEVDPSVRLGTCMCYDTWDMDGTDGIALAYAFAGRTKPFLRTIGAPYHDIRVGAAVEATRAQAAWCRDAGIEIYAEGDVYPRPRYNVPACSLELFDLALLASGAVDGDQKYMFDYTRHPSYEPGYVARHVKNAPLRAGIDALFGDKTPVGVRVVEQMHKVEAWDLPEKLPAPLGRYLHKAFRSRAARMLSEAAVPTAYTDTGYPAVIFGENARGITAAELKNGALLDVTAARILQEQGIDVGLLHAEPHTFAGEYYRAKSDTVMGLSAVPFCKMEVSAHAEITTLLLPDRAPGSYRYENREGLRFAVIACDTYAALPDGKQKEYYNNYYRQQELRDALVWVGRKPLPVRCDGNPYLYAICAEDAEGTALSVALFNVFEDEILQPVVTLSRPYTAIRFVSGKGRLEGDRVILEEIPPFGTAVFEVQ